MDKGSVDINLLIGRTKRVFGKFNLDPGIVPRSFNNRILDEFALSNGDIININVNHLDKDIIKEKVIKLDVKTNVKKNNSGKYIPPYKAIVDKPKKKKPSKKSQKKKFSFKEDDFPEI